MAAAGQRRQRRFTVLRCLYRVSFVLEHAAQGLANAGLVIHQQDSLLLHRQIDAGRAAAVSPAASLSASAGISIVKRAPAGWLSSTRICVLCSVRMWLTIASPRPVPRFF